MRGGEETNVDSKGRKIATASLCAAKSGTMLVCSVRLPLTLRSREVYRRRCVSRGPRRPRRFVRCRPTRRGASSTTSAPSCSQVGLSSRWRPRWASRSSTAAARPSSSSGPCRRRCRRALPTKSDAIRRTQALLLASVLHRSPFHDTRARRTPRTGQSSTRRPAAAGCGPRAATCACASGPRADASTSSGWTRAGRACPTSPRWWTRWAAPSRPSGRTFRAAGGAHRPKTRPCSSRATTRGASSCTGGHLRRSPHLASQLRARPHPAFSMHVWAAPCRAFFCLCGHCVSRSAPLAPPVQRP